MHPRSMSKISICLALLLSVWQIYFFWLSGRSLMGPLDGVIGIFKEDRVGMNLAWLMLIYLSVQLISIPFTSGMTGARFLGALDAMASMVPLIIVVIAIVSGAALMSADKIEAALLLLVVNLVDIFGGYIFTIALSRKVVDFTHE